MHHGQTRREDKKSKIGKNILHFHSRQYKRPTKLAHCNAYRQLQEYILQHRYISLHRHRRRLVINIGGAKIWVTNIGGTKILGKFIFRQKILKKFPSILSKISDDLFFSHRQLFKKIYTFHSKCSPFSLYGCLCFFHSKCTPFSLYCCLCFCFLSCLFFSIKKIKKFSFDYWRGKKGVLPPILIIGGACPGCPPESTPMSIDTFLSIAILPYIHRPFYFVAT